MRIRTRFGAAAGVVLAGLVALTGCTSTSVPNPSGTGGQPADAAASFLACLKSAGVEAKINDNGMVLVKQAGAGPDGSVSTGSGDRETLLIEGDAAGDTWVAPVDAGYFADDPDTQDAYAACEQKHPDFTQPQYDPNSDPEHQQQAAEQQEAALAFAQCARRKGFTQIADPDAGTGGAIMIPDDFTETDFRALVEACYEPNSSFAFGTSDSLGFEPWQILEEFQNAAHE